MIDRPHVEFICPEVISRAPRRLPFSRDSLPMRVLVAEPEAGNGAAIVEIPPGWHADVDVSDPFELLVLEGALEVEGQTLGPYGYVSGTPGADNPAISSPGRTLAFVDAIADVRSSSVVPWTDDGFAKASTPGLERKVMRDVDGDPRAWFLRIPRGWTMELTEWHDCAEAAFRLEGDVWHDRANGGAGGTMHRHCYFWRPAHGLHGPMGSVGGSLSWVYVDGRLVSHFVEEEGEPPSA
jgi:hypothetical protein